MTIASEITRLQWAKSDARTSIINKGVDVPASAKLDTYHNYIDLIETTWATWLLSWAWLMYYRWGLESNSCNITWYYSWVEDDVLYGLLVGNQWVKNSSNIYYWGVWVKHVPWNSTSYTSGTTWASYARHTDARNSYFIKNTTAGIVRGYCLEPADYTSNWVYTYQTEFDYKNNTVTTTLYSTGESYNLADIVTVPDWYTVVSGNEWIWNVITSEVRNDSTFNIVIK